MSGKGPVLVVDDEEIVRDSLASWLTEDGYTVDTAPDGPTALEMLRVRPYAVVLGDLKMPGMDGLEMLVRARRLRPETPIILMTAYATVETAVQAMKQGAHDYLVKPFEPEDLSQMVARLTPNQAPRPDDPQPCGAVGLPFCFQGMVSRSAKMEAVFELGRAAARTDAPVLIRGENGTGKRTMARAIHRESPRADRPFISVPCATLTEVARQKRLFGGEAEAWSGFAGDPTGNIARAAGGTLFLEEIGEASATLQTDLLHVLDRSEQRRTCATRAARADARVIAATCRDLQQLVEAGRFPAELYYRLNVISITIPPLRERREDIACLPAHFLTRVRAETRKPLDGVSIEALELLMAHDWPGNVRELRKVVECAARVAQGSRLTPADVVLHPSA